MNNTFKIALEDYINHLEIARGLTDKTIEEYEIVLKVFVGYLNDNIFKDKDTCKLVGHKNISTTEIFTHLNIVESINLYAKYLLLIYGNYSKICISN